MTFSRPLHFHQRFSSEHFCIDVEIIASESLFFRAMSSELTYLSSLPISGGIVGSNLFIFSIVWHNISFSVYKHFCIKYLRCYFWKLYFARIRIRSNILKFLIIFLTFNSSCECLDHRMIGGFESQYCLKMTAQLYPGHLNKNWSRIIIVSE